jgi:hypothetical protein
MGSCRRLDSADFFSVPCDLTYWLLAADAAVIRNDKDAGIAAIQNVYAFFDQGLRRPLAVISDSVWKT